MKKEHKIRSPFVQQLIEDRENIENMIKDTTKSSLNSMLEEAVKKELNNILKEDEDEDEYEEVNSTEDATDVDSTENELPSDEVEDATDDEATETEDDGAESQDELPDSSELGSDEDEWSEFEKYKVDDDTYDFRNADNDTFIKVYKLLKDDDKIFVDTDEEGNTHITDNETGNEYMIVNDKANEESGEAEDFDGMDESKIYEITLDDEDEDVNEENLGYTDDYQKKTAMTTPSNEEPADKKSTYSMDAGVPTGTEKPWVGNAGDMEPFTEETENCEDENVEEGTNVGGFVQQNSTSKSHVPNSSGRSARNASVAGVHTKSTSQPRYSQSVSEDIKRKANALWEENKQMKKELLNIKKSLQEAVVLNYNLGQITKLFTENTTSKEEKIDIIKRFGTDAKTIEDSKKLYESISRELKKTNKINDVNSIDKPFTESKKNLQETTLYQSDELNESLSLMKRLINL